MLVDRPNITLSPNSDLPYWIERKGSFESAHRLQGHPKCGKLHGHSYNYIVIARADSLTDNWGFVIDFSDISAYFNRYDHSDVVITTSCEEFTQQACRDFMAMMPQVEAEVHVFLQETGKSWAGFTLRKSLPLNIPKPAPGPLHAVASFGN